MHDARVILTLNLVFTHTAESQQTEQIDMFVISQKSFCACECKSANVMETMPNTLIELTNLA